MTSIRWSVCVACVVGLVGCGDDDRGPGGSDAGGRTDTGMGGGDSGGRDDTGTPGTDTGVPEIDAGPDCVDLDGDGYGEGDCMGADCDDDDPAVNEGGVESCNGTDDDCDGTVDDGFAGLGEACTAGVGACEASGTNVCMGDGTGIECDAVAGSPGTETCNGMDDDCDGTADNGFAGLGDPCTAGVGACEASGTNVCSMDGSAVACDAVAGMPGAETCNSVDDDCNGTADDGLGSTSCGVGACAAMVENCVGGVPQICTPGTPGAETCNGADDDCNGTADDGLGTMSCGVGACAASVASCIGGVPQVCVPGTPSAEVCNGADDDCNGTADDGIAPISCGIGSCGRTVPGCVGGAPGMCVPGPAVADVCPANGMDEDCDGMNDDGCPANDERLSATNIVLGAAEATVTGTTTGAARDGSAVACGCTTGGNVWYRFTLVNRSVVYIDTAGSTYDTSVWITNSAGAPVGSLCNDDGGCASGSGWTSGLQSRVAGVLAAGTYYISVSGCGTGNFTLHLQAIRTNVGSFFYETPITGTATTSTSLVGASASTSVCGGTASGEDVRWFQTCGGQQQFFSLCVSDGGTFSRQIGARLFDPSAYILSGITGTIVTCNDDGGSMGGTNCVGTGGDALQYGSRLNNVTVGRGIHAAFIDERVGGAGMTYSLRYTVR